MKIPVPQYVLKYDDWTDRELVLLSLMQYLYSYEGCRLGYVYNFNSVDIKRMLNLMNSINPERHIEKLRRVLKVGMLSWDVWSLSLNPTKFDKTRNGRVEKGWVEIQEVEAIGLFHYLAGRLTAPEIIQDHTAVLETEKVKGKKVGTIMDHFFAETIFYDFQK